MYDFLRQVPFFADLPDKDLKRVAERANEVQLAAGDVLFEEGSEGDTTYCIKEGELEILQRAGGQEVLVAVRRAGDVVGEMSLLQQVPRNATLRARTASCVVEIRKEDFDELIESNPSALRAMLITVMGRLRESEGMRRQGEKMAQLGTLTAGVAHELNNPAAAARRAAEQLSDELARYESAATTIGKSDFTPEELEVLVEELSRARKAGASPPELDPLVRSDIESEIEQTLEAHGFENAWEIAGRLVDVRPDMEALTTVFAQEHLPAALELFSSNYAIHALTREIGTASGRLSEIVRALKKYSYLDQAPIQEVDLHEGLDDTLMLLRGEISGVTVSREYADDLPHVMGYGSELNQVWTNLIDNALDALDGSGELTLRTRREGDWAVVEVIDSGPGIPEDVQSRVFDPFFTTKEPGKGTGLGLDTSYKIVADRHRGDLRLESVPGNTRFEVWLPVNFERDTS